MNFGHLAVFHAVAEAGSVSRAAERLMVSQPAVSKQLGQLERALKTVLVDRLPRGVRLTAAGEVLAGYARRIFATAEEAERAMGELAGVRRGRLAMAATPTIGTYWLPGVLVKYRREYPGVEMRMEVHPTATIVRLLREGAVDVGLVESEVEDDGVEAREFMRDRLVAIAAKGWARSRKRKSGVTATELCREPFVVREVGSGSLSLVERALAARGLKVRAAMSLGSTEAIKRAVMEGVGVAIVSRMAVEGEVKGGRLAEVPVRDLAVERPLFWCVARGRGNSSAVAAFEKLVWEAAHR
jgi:DNA-binding transcriptional LysR family regulator